MLPIFEELRSAISGEIVEEEETIGKKSIDKSIFRVRPQVIIFPKTTHDLKTIILFTRKYHIPLTVRGKGGGNSGGSLGEGIIIEMSRYFDTIQRLEIENNTITVSSGVSVRELLHKIEPWGYTLPYSNKNILERTFGGLFGDGYRNPLSEQYSGIVNSVEKIKVVLDDGNEYIISKDINPSGRLLEVYTETLQLLTKSTRIIQAHEPAISEHSMGYCVYSSHISPMSLISTLAGSQGTFGIVTEITLKLIPSKDISTETQNVTPKQFPITLDPIFDLPIFDLALKEIKSLSVDLEIPLEINPHIKSGVILINVLELPSAEKIIELLTHMAHIIKYYRGASTCGSGDGLLWTPFLPYIFGAKLMKVMQELKTIWDPQNIFNTGKKTTTDIAFIKKHYNP